MNLTMKPSVQTQCNDFIFSEADFQMIATFAKAKYGLFLQPSKKALVYSRLTKRLRALKLASFKDYCSLLEQPDGKDEQTHLLSAITTNVTHFFREMHHFDFLKNTLAPSLVAKCANGGSVRLWSAACSSGQEAYCMAAALLAGEPRIAEYDVKILATDIDPIMVSKAVSGSFPYDQLEAVPDEWHDLLFLKTKGEETQLEINSNVRKMISFGELNLMDSWPMRRNFDVIFCRNAAIYFDKETQANLWQRFSNMLADDGHLMIGHSERLAGPAEKQFKSVGITTYRKIIPSEQNTQSTVQGEHE